MAEPYIDVDGAADMLAVSKRTVYRWMELLDPPYYKIGGSLRFRASEIEQWAARFRESDEPRD